MFLFALFIGTARCFIYPHPEIPVHTTTCSTTDRGPRCYIHLRWHLFDHAFICITSVMGLIFHSCQSGVQMFPVCLFPRPLFTWCNCFEVFAKRLHSQCTLSAQSSKRRNSLWTVHFTNTQCTVLKAEKTKGEEAKQINSRHIDSVSAQPL